MGFETVDEMRETIARRTDQAKGFARARRYEEGVRVALAERLDGEVPEAMVESTAARCSATSANLEASGTNLQEYMEQTGTTSLRSRRTSRYGRGICGAGAGA